MIAEFGKLNFVEFSCIACLRPRVKISCLTGVKSVGVTCCVTADAGTLASAILPVNLVAATSTIFASVTVPSEGVPIANVSPNTVIKSIESVPDNELAKVIVLPETVNAVIGAWITPFKDTIKWYAVSGT